MSSTRADRDSWRDLTEGVTSLLAATGVGGGFQLRRLTGGRNNQVYLVSTQQAEFVAKSYFSSSAAERDRLGSEFGFCRFCWDKGCTSVPRPLARDAERGLALYEHIEGIPLRVGEDLEEYVAAAARFVVDLNQHRGAPEATRLPEAAEACFRIQDHLRCVDGRVARLRRIGGTSVDEQATRFVDEKLIPVWNRVRSSMHDNAEPLSSPDRCLSPSDFGFHNALLTPAGTLRFLDFEYAGWDDPAKLVCDFFCQIEHPVPIAHWETMVDAAASVVEHSADFCDRCSTLFPVYLIKWACIVLNEFLPEHRARREFSAAKPPSDDQLLVQIAKADTLLARID